MVDLMMLIIFIVFLGMWGIIVRDMVDNKLFIWVLITFNITNKNCYYKIINWG
jgi:hypothetical protein